MGKFTLDLTRIVEKTKLSIDQVVQRSTEELFTKIIFKSPVDRGMFRGNWTASEGSYSSNIYDTFDISGTETINAMKAIVQNTKAGGIVYMVNNLPYAQRLEYGYSQQAPTGVVRTSVVEFQQYVKNASMGV